MFVKKKVKRNAQYSLGGEVSPTFCISRLPPRKSVKPKDKKGPGLWRLKWNGGDDEHSSYFNQRKKPYQETSDSVIVCQFDPLPTTQYGTTCHMSGRIDLFIFCPVSGLWLWQGVLAPIAHDSRLVQKRVMMVPGILEKFGMSQSLCHSHNSSENWAHGNIYKYSMYGIMNLAATSTVPT